MTTTVFSLIFNTSSVVTTIVVWCFMRDGVALFSFSSSSKKEITFFFFLVFFGLKRLESPSFSRTDLRGIGDVGTMLYDPNRSKTEVHDFGLLNQSKTEGLVGVGEAFSSVVM